MNERKQSILEKVSEKEEKRNIGLILDILHLGTGKIYTLPNKIDKETIEYEKSEFSENKKNEPIQFVSIGSDVQSEIDLIRDTIKKYHTIHLLVFGKKTQEFMYQLLQ